jgi:hypothetical protein
MILTVTDNADDTGAVATVSGAAVGANVALYRSVIDGKMLTSPAFAFIAARVGSGTIPAPGPKGFYWWFAASHEGDYGEILTEDDFPILTEDGGLILTGGGQKEISNMVYQNVTDGAEAVHERCLAAVQNRAVLLLAGRSHIESIVRQQKPSDLNVTLQSIVVTTWDLQQSDEGGTNAHDDIGRRVRILIATNDVNDLTSEARWHKDREILFRGFHNQRLPGVDEVSYCIAEPSTVAAEDPNKTTYTLGSLDLLFRCREPRGFGV